MPLDQGPQPKSAHSDASYSASQFARDLLSSAAYSGVAAPTEGVLQIVDNVTGTKLQPESQKVFSTLGVQAPGPDASGAKWLAQTLGSAGMALPLLLLAKPVRGLMSHTGSCGIFAERTAIGLSVQESAVTGLVQGTVFLPSENKDNFWLGRLQNGVGSSLNFAAMTAATHGINKFGDTGFAAKHRLNVLLTNPMLSGALGGIPGGVVGAEIEAVKQGRVLPTSAELSDSILSNTLMGGVFGAKHQIKELRAVRSSTTEHSQHLLNNSEVRSLIRAPRLDPQAPEFLKNLPPSDLGIPQPSGAWTSRGQSQVAAWRLGEIEKTASGQTIVRDLANQVERTYSGAGRLVEAKNLVDGNKQTYAYNSVGDLRAVITDQNQGWFKVKGGWSQGGINAQSGRLELFPPQAKSAVVDGDGVLLASADRAWSVPLTPRWQVVRAEAAEITNWNVARERQVADYLVNHNSNGSPYSVLPSGLANFRAAASENGVKSGLGQFEAEVNRSLTVGNSTDVLQLLQASSKLVATDGVTALQAARTANGAPAMSAEGYPKGAFSKFSLDGTVVESQHLSRTTTKADGTKTTEYFDGDKTRTMEYGADGRIQQFKLNNNRGQILQDVDYAPDGSIKTITYSSTATLSNDRAVKTTKLSQHDAGWRIEQSVAGRPELASEVNLGQGTVRIIGDDLVHFESASSGRFLIYLQDGKVAQNFAGRNTELTPGESNRLFKASFESETQMRQELIQAKLTGPEREHFTAASAELDLAATRLGLSNDKQALLLVEVNNLLATAPSRATELVQKIVETTKAIDKPESPQSNGPDLAISKIKDRTEIYIGNQTIEIQQSGKIAVKNNLLMRFAGTTDAGFKSSVVQTANDLSPEIRQLLTKHGTVIIGAETVPDVLPNIAGQRGKGWANGTTLAALDAYYSAADKRIVVAQTHVAYSHNRVSTVLTQNPQVALLRAVGHSVDDALGSYSTSNRFSKAFESDVGRLSAVEKDQFHFYLGAEPKEGKANLFSDLFAGANTQRKIDQTAQLRKHFPNTSAMVDEAMAVLKAGGKTVDDVIEPSAESSNTSSAETFKVDRRNAMPIHELPKVQELLSTAVGSKSVAPEFITSQMGDLKAAIPVATGAARLSTDAHGATVKTTPWLDGNILKYADGRVDVVDTLTGITRTFDANGRIIRAAHSEDGKNLQQYFYNASGAPKAVFTSDVDGYINTANGWKKISLTENGENLVVDSNYQFVAPHPAGGVVAGREHSAKVQMVSGHTGDLTKFGLDFDKADHAYETGLLHRQINNLADPAKKDQFRILANKFTDLAAQHKISETGQASVLAEVSRTLRDHPDQSLRLLETANSWLAEGKFNYLSVDRQPDQTVSLFLRGVDHRRTLGGDGKIQTYGSTAKEVIFPDGTKEVQSYGQGNPTFKHDAQGNLVLLSFPEPYGSTRTYKRDASGAVIETLDQLKDGRSVKLAQAGATGAKDTNGPNWIKTTIAKDGQEQRTDLGQGKIDITEEGSVAFQPSAVGQRSVVFGRPGVETSHHPNQRIEQINEHGRSEFIAANHKFESDLLRTSIKGVFNGEPTSQQRSARFEKLLTQYEQHATTHGVPPEKQALVLLQLNRLLAPNPQAKLSLPERADVAELLLAHVIEPTKIWQGAHPTCNVTTIEHRLAVQAPDKLIQMVADIAVQGQYIRTDGRRVEASTIVGAFKPDQDSANNLVQQRSAAGPILNDEGTRDWASQIAQGTLVRSALMDKEIYLVGNHIAPEFSVAWVLEPTKGVYKAVKVDPTKIQKLDPRHLDWERLYDANRMVIGMVPRESSTPLRNRTGQWLDSLAAGETAYDAFGRPLIHRTSADELGFGPTSLSEDTFVLLRDNQKSTPIVEPDANLSTTPQLGLIDISNAYASVDNSPTQPFILKFGPSNSSSNLGLHTRDELLAAVDKLASAGQLPAILTVHTRSQAFGHWKDGGYHVVNLYGRAEGDQQLRYSNQWGVNADRMTDGISADILLAAMRDPVMRPAMPQMLTPLTRLNSSNTNAIASKGTQTGEQPFFNSTAVRNRFHWLDKIFESWQER